MAKRVNITSNDNWTAQGIPAWVQGIPQSGQGDAALDVSVQENLSGYDRSTIFSLQTGGGAIAQMGIYQYARHDVVFSGLIQESDSLDRYPMVGYTINLGIVDRTTGAESVIGNAVTGADGRYTAQINVSPEVHGNASNYFAGIVNPPEGYANTKIYVSNTFSYAQILTSGIVISIVAKMPSYATQMRVELYNGARYGQGYRNVRTAKIYLEVEGTTYEFEGDASQTGTIITYFEFTRSRETFTYTLTAVSPGYDVRIQSDTISYSYPVVEMLLNPKTPSGDVREAMAPVDEPTRFTLKDTAADEVIQYGKLLAQCRAVLSGAYQNINATPYCRVLYVDPTPVGSNVTEGSVLVRYQMYTNEDLQ